MDQQSDDIAIVGAGAAGLTGCLVVDRTSALAVRRDRLPGVSGVSVSGVRPRLPFWNMAAAHALFSMDELEHVRGLLECVVGSVERARGSKEMQAA